MTSIVVVCLISSALLAELVRILKALRVITVTVNKLYNYERTNIWTYGLRVYKTVIRFICFNFHRFSIMADYRRELPYRGLGFWGCMVGWAEFGNKVRVQCYWFRVLSSILEVLEVQQFWKQFKCEIISESDLFNSPLFDNHARILLDCLHGANY